MKHGAALRPAASSVSQTGLRGMDRPTWQAGCKGGNHKHYLALQYALLFKIVQTTETAVWRFLDVVGVSGGFCSVCSLSAADRTAQWRHLQSGDEITWSPISVTRRPFHYKAPYAQHSTAWGQSDVSHLLYDTGAGGIKAGVFQRGACVTGNSFTRHSNSELCNALTPFPSSVYLILLLRSPATLITCVSAFSSVG